MAENGIRKITKNPIVMSVIAIVTVLLAFFVITSGSSNDYATKKWYYDTFTGDLFSEDASVAPPITNPSGSGQAAEAVVVNVNGQDEISFLKTTMVVNEVPGEYVALPPAEGADIDWVNMSSPEGMQLLVSARDAMRAKNGGEDPEPSTP